MSFREEWKSTAEEEQLGTRRHRVCRGLGSHRRPLAEGIEAVVSSAPGSHPREPVSFFANDMATTCTSANRAETRIWGKREK